MSNYVGGAGNPNAKLMLVGEAPGEKEDEEGEPFVGPVGEITREMVEEAGMPWEETYRTNVLRHRPPNNKVYLYEKAGYSISDDTRDLWEEIKQIKPYCILSLGAIAFRALCKEPKLIDYRGSILQSRNGLPKVVPTWHPSNLLYSREEIEGKRQGIVTYKAKAYMKLDFKRAVVESKYRERHLPDRKLYVVKTADKLYEFIYRNKVEKKRRRFATDTETIKGIPFCASIAFTANEAVSVPLFNLPMADERDHVNDRELLYMHTMLAELLEDEEMQIIAQNGKFDCEKYRMIGIKVKLWWDTMLAMNTLYPEFPASLAFQTSIMTREPFYKSEGKEFNPAKDRMEVEWIYNARDSAVCFEIFERQEKQMEKYELMDFFFNLVMPCHELYMEMERVGFGIDFDKRLEVYRKYKKWEDELQRELDDIAERHINVASPKQVSQFMYSDLGLPIRTKDGKPTTGEEVVFALLGMLDDMPETEYRDTQRRALNIIAELRKVRRTRNGPLTSMPDYDLRFKSTYRLFKETGRTSTGLLDPPVRPHKIGWPFQTLSKHGEIGPHMREFLIP